MTRISNAYRTSLLCMAVFVATIAGCASEKAVAPADVAPVLAAVVHAVDSVVGPKDSLAIDPRILLRPTMWRRKPVITDWPQADLATAIGPGHPRLELGMLAFVCPVRAPGCSATKQRAVLALAMPLLQRDTAVVEAMYAGRSSDDRVNELHWLWFLVRLDGVWRIAKHTTIDRT